MTVGSYGSEVVIFFLFLLFRVIQSKNDKYEEGCVVSAMFGWVTHTICNDNMTAQLRLVKVDTTIVPEEKLSLALGVLGMPG